MSFDPFNQKLIAKVRKDPFHVTQTVDAANAPTLHDPFTGKDRPNPAFKGRLHGKPQKVFTKPPRRHAPPPPHHKPGPGVQFTSRDPKHRLEDVLNQHGNDPALRGVPHMPSPDARDFILWLMEQIGHGAELVGKTIAVVLNGIGGFVVDVSSAVVNKFNQLRATLQRAMTFTDHTQLRDIIGWTVTVLVLIGGIAFALLG